MEPHQCHAEGTAGTSEPKREPHAPGCKDLAVMVLVDGKSERRKLACEDRACWHQWDTCSVNNADRWRAGQKLVSRRACRFQEHPDRACEEWSEGAGWIEPANFPNRQDEAS
jgi:hypothetical protein